LLGTLEQSRIGKDSPLLELVQRGLAKIARLLELVQLVQSSLAKKARLLELLLAVVDFLDHWPQNVQRSGSKIDPLALTVGEVF
jgi:hypothetical protein